MFILKCHTTPPPNQPVQYTIIGPLSFSDPQRKQYSIHDQNDKHLCNRKEGMVGLRDGLFGKLNTNPRYVEYRIDMHNVYTTQMQTVASAACIQAPSLFEIINDLGVQSDPRHNLAIQTNTVYALSQYKLISENALNMEMESLFHYSINTITLVSVLCGTHQHRGKGSELMQHILHQETAHNRRIILFTMPFRELFNYYTTLGFEATPIENIAYLMIHNPTLKKSCIVQ